MKPIRILHVVWGLGIGGVETGLMGVLRRLQGPGYHMDFLVHTDEEGVHEREIRSRGGRVFRCPEFSLRPVSLRSYVHRFNAALDQGGPYDVLHCHYDVAGVALWLARRRGVPVRIAHSRNSAPELRFWHPLARGALRPLTRGLIHRYATHGLAVSEPAAVAKFGKGWRTDRRWSVERSGIDLSTFRLPQDRTAWRRRLSVPDDAWILGHVGRFGPAKNHSFLLAVAAEIFRRRPNTRLLVIGDGNPTQRSAVVEEARRRGIENQTLFVGFQTDVAGWLRGAVDVLVFPSLYEGLPLAVIEAQAAGVPVVMSENVTEEAVVLPQLVRRLSLGLGSAGWADEALRLSEDPGRPAPDEAWRRMNDSPFNIDRVAASLARFYDEAAAAAAR